jgi:hypothetical protein
MPHGHVPRDSEEQAAEATSFPVDATQDFPLQELDEDLLR